MTSYVVSYLSWQGPFHEQVPMYEYGVLVLELEANMETSYLM